MWLIDTDTVELKEVRVPESHPYAVLSHTWKDDQEVTFRSFMGSAGDYGHGMSKPGFRKIAKTCQLAKDRGIRYAWVDTCCIDKSSSAELSEAINSMFQWYAQAEVCFVYLADLTTTDDDDFRSCRWFRRGWTLQELIAPCAIEFYDASWAPRGTKASLTSLLSSITRIDADVLLNHRLLPSIPVAKRMSWAADRGTTRIEDRAYCLFGIFDVHLPLIYGEGAKSFIRLQEAIIQESTDLSLFSWTSQSDEKYRGLFALSPDEFKYCDKIKREISPLLAPASFSLTNKGVQISAARYPGTFGNGEIDILMDLQCYDMARQRLDGTDGSVFIRLVKTPHNYVRHSFRQPVAIPRSGFAAAHGSSSTIHIPKVIRQADSEALVKRLAARFEVKLANRTHHEVAIGQESPGHLWESRGQSFITDNHESFKGSFNLAIQGGTYEPNFGTVLAAVPKLSSTKYDTQNFEWPLCRISLGLRQQNISGSSLTDTSDDRIVEVQPWAKIDGHGNEDTVTCTPTVNDHSSEELFISSYKDYPKLLLKQHAISVSISTTKTVVAGLESYTLKIHVRNSPWA